QAAGAGGAPLQAHHQGGDAAANTMGDVALDLRLPRTAPLPLLGGPGTRACTEGGGGAAARPGRHGPGGARAGQRGRCRARVRSRTRPGRRRPMTAARPAQSRWRRHWPLLRRLLLAAFLLAVGWLLVRQAMAIDWPAVWQAMRAQPRGRL